MIAEMISVMKEAVSMARQPQELVARRYVCLTRLLFAARLFFVLLLLHSLLLVW